MSASTDNPTPRLSRATLLDNLEVRISEADLQTRLKAMGEEINRVYKDSERIIVIGILKGSFLFMADLVRYIDVPCHVEFVRLSSYGNNKSSSGTVRPVDLSLPKLEGEDVLIVEDIIDTGLTMKFFRDYLANLHHTQSLRIAVLLDKACARTEPVELDFVGFEVGNEFLVGYGLDYAGYYRNLPYIGVVKDPAEGA